MTDCRTASAQGPPQPQRSDQRRHNVSVSSSSRNASRPGRRSLCERCQVSTNGTHSPCATANSAVVRKFSPISGTGVLQLYRMRAGYGADPAVSPADPRHDASIAEAEHEFRPHRDGAAPAFDKPHDIDFLLVLGSRHKVDDGAASALGRELGFEDQGAVPVAPGDRMHLARRSDQPSAILRRAEQRAEAGFRIEPRQAQPVHRSVAADRAARCECCR